MIDAEIRAIVEAELRDGEALLWAEKTNHEAQKFHKNWFQLKPARKRVLIAIWVMSVVGLIVLFNVPAGIDIWGSTTQRLIFNVIGGVAIYAFLIPSAAFIQNLMLKGRIYRIGAYALTNRRLFEFDHDHKIIRHLDASRLQHVYGMEGVTLKPIGSKWPRSYQLGLMNNNVLTINYLHGQITKARQQRAE